MHVYELRVTVKTTEEAYLETMVDIAMQSYIRRARRRGDHDAAIVQDWEVEEIFYREQEDE